jgi:pimeloyl-ACP methyl ester carboxylesterase
VSSQNSATSAPHRLFRKAKYGVDKFILVGKYKIHYVEAGQGAPVVLIPGSYSTYRAWNRLMPILGKEYQLLALDYLGVGDSDKPRRGFDYTIQEQTDLIAAMVRQLGLTRVNLIGGSYGGAIVFDFAARYPDLVHKTVSIEGGVVRPQKMKNAPLEYCLKFPVIGDLFLQVARSGALNRPAARAIAGKWYPSMTPSDRKETLEQVDSNVKTASRIPWYKISIARKTSGSIEEAAKSIKSPVLYLYGTQSNFKEILLDENIAYLKQYLPHAWIVALEGGIHDLALQKPAEVADLILDFLRARPAPVLSRPKR